MKNLLCFFFLLIFVPSYAQRLTYSYAYSEYDGNKYEAEYELTFDMRDHVVIIGDGLGRPFVFQYESIAQHTKTRALIAYKCGLRLVFSTNYAVLFNGEEMVRSWYNFSIPKHYE